MIYGVYYIVYACNILQQARHETFLPVYVYIIYIINIRSIYFIIHRHENLFPVRPQSHQDRRQPSIEPSRLVTCGTPRTSTKSLISMCRIRIRALTFQHFSPQGTHPKGLSRGTSSQGVGVSLGTSAVRSAVRRTSTKSTTKATASSVRTDCSGANRKSKLTNIVSGKNLHGMFQGKLRAKELHRLSVAVSKWSQRNNLKAAAFIKAAGTFIIMYKRSSRRRRCIGWAYQSSWTYLIICMGLLRVYKRNIRKLSYHICIFVYYVYRCQRSGTT